MSTPVSEAAIREWIIDYLASLFALPRESIDIRQSFTALGLDSSAAAAMSGDLADWLGIEVDPALPYDFINTEELAGEVARIARSQQP